MIADLHLSVGDYKPSIAPNPISDVYIFINISYFCAIGAMWYMGKTRNPLYALTEILD
jgi:hypothetical protein